MLLWVAQHTKCVLWTGVLEFETRPPSDTKHQDISASAERLEIALYKYII